MRSHVNIVTQAQFATFLKQGGKVSGPPGLAVFNANGCGSCHTLKAANAIGKVGPDLDNLKQEAAQAHRGALAQFIQESIVDPNAYVQPGYQPNVMPGTFKTQIPAKQLSQLVQYLAQNAH
jgi:cytochrome c551/c552